MTDESSDARRARAALERLDAEASFKLGRTREGHASVLTIRGSDWRALRPFVIRGLEVAATPPPDAPASPSGETA